MINFDYKNMTPFKWFVLENFPFIENDFEAINNYRLFSKVVEYLNKMKDNVNLTGQQMENLTNAMIELQNYVNNYFDNLDVQDEINNKLDELVTNGTLYNIMRPYFTSVDTKLIQIENKVNSVASGSPLVASSVSEMTDTSRVYVNTTDGHWYYYDGTAWTDGGVYQSTTYEDKLENIVSNVVSGNSFNYNYQITEGGFWNTTGGFTSYQASRAIKTSPIKVNEGDKFYYRGRGDASSVCLYWLDKELKIIGYKQGKYEDVFHEFTPILNAVYVIFCSYSTSENIIFDLYRKGNYKGDTESISTLLDNLSGNDNARIHYENYIDGFWHKNHYFETYENYYSKKTNLIKINKNDTIYYKGVGKGNASSIYWYDVNGNYINSSQYDSPDNFTVVNNIPENAIYAEFCSYQVSERPILDIRIQGNYLPTLINPSEPITPPSITYTPLISIVDDDGFYDYIPTMKNLCDEIGVKCTFAVIANKMEETPQLINLLQNYQKEGFHITSHSYSHSNIWNSPSSSKNSIYEDIIKSYNLFNQNNFYDFRNFVTPNGIHTGNPQKCVKEWADCLLATKDNGVDKVNYDFSNRYSLWRIFIEQSKGLQYYKNFIDECYANNGWLIFGTHSGDVNWGSNEFNPTFVKQVINYAIEKGIEILPVNSAFKKRKPFYDYYELSNNS